MSNVDLERLIRLTNIEVEPEILEKFSESVKNILEWTNELQTVDTTNVDPMFSVFDLINKGLENLREDVVNDGDMREKILLNAPDKNEMFICVPKVIEQE
ncbi:MAG: Asp-tRNA(Asn)/Glu-tRNA(Gln) amidotransferase subunit GatC [Alphaproteobacteria bacterium]|jgi:aspartyl-tRNA(Asn)/glutamyl-tRNA(Gln) amidotransferase subunit C|nr:Asp-tRNA(Asn)/Glu-tRNA(Gln) amidotransferase subunit GatC [Alphaproteobacteria bacterium]